MSIIEQTSANFFSQLALLQPGANTDTVKRALQVFTDEKMSLSEADFEKGEDRHFSLSYPQYPEEAKKYVGITVHENGVLKSLFCYFEVGSFGDPESFKGIFEQLMVDLQSKLGVASAQMCLSDLWITDNCPDNVTIAAAYWDKNPVLEVRKSNASVEYENYCSRSNMLINAEFTLAKRGQRKDDEWVINCTLTT